MALYEVVIDGASRGHGMDERGGLGAAGVVIYKNRKKIGEYARCLGRCTNNKAEYEALIAALLMCWAAELEDPIIYSDSLLVVNQVSGKWQCTTEELKALLFSVKQIQEVYRFRLIHSKRMYTAVADKLANKALDQFLSQQED